MDDKTLWNIAIEARKHSYAPYSKFLVGAALLCEDGTVIKGCNIENSTYGATNCAERTAFFTAIAQGKRSFRAIAVAGGTKDTLQLCYPCGICCQVMNEYCDGSDFKVICGLNEKKLEVLTLEELLPKSFKMQD